MKALLDFFSLSVDPFSDTPDTSFLYSSATHREAFATLLWGINANRGFIGLTAKPGMGKTTLLFKLMKELNHAATFAFVFQTQADPDNMLRHLVADLGLPSDGNPAQIHAELNRFLRQQAKLGKRVLLIVDEAQNLQDSVLEMLRLISDFETEQRKLVQFILSGQTQLVERLATPSLEQLRQRIAAIARIEPFDEKEVAHYIRHRLAVARRTGPDLFSDEAVRLIAQASRGIPREINSIAFSSLCIAYATRRREIDVDVVREGINDRSLPLISKQTEVNQLSTVTRTERIATKNSTFSPMNDRRRSARRSADLQYARSGEQRVGLILNIGPGGAALWVSTPKDWGDSQIQFQIPGSVQPLHVEGKVVWKHESQRLIGVIFSDVSEPVRAQLETWTEANRVEEGREPSSGECNHPSRLARSQEADSKPAEGESRSSDSKLDGLAEAGQMQPALRNPRSTEGFPSASPLSILNPDLKAHTKRFRELWLSRARTNSR